MTATLIDGKAIAKTLRGKVADAAAQVRDSIGRAPGLAVVLVGDDPASQVYVRNKDRATHRAGMAGTVRRLAATTTQAELHAVLKELNEDDLVDGILLQLPLPGGLDDAAAIAQISPSKDVDGLTAQSAGHLMLGRPGLIPCTPQGSMILATSVEPDLTGAHAVVLGRSILVGKPLSLLLQQANATVTMAHSRTKDVKAVCQSADILCAAVGRPELVRGDWIKPGAVVIDVGINRVEEGDASRLVGDVAFEEAQEVAKAITPVPGGVGPMTIACLLRNTVLAAARRNGLRDPI